MKRLCRAEALFREVIEKLHFTIFKKGETC